MSITNGDSVSININIPEDYKLTGEYRSPKQYEYFLDEDGRAIQNDSPTAWKNGPRLILVRDSVPILKAPTGWQAMKWAVKDNHGKWFVTNSENPPVYEGGGWVIYDIINNVLVRDKLVGLKVPESIDSLPPHKSLVKLVNYCEWEGKGDEQYMPECSPEVSWFDLTNYCPDCGRPVKVR